MDSLEGLDIPDDAVLARTVRVTPEEIWNERLGRYVSWRYDRILWDGGSLPEHSQGEDYELYGWDRFRERYNPRAGYEGFSFYIDDEGLSSGLYIVFDNSGTGTEYELRVFAASASKLIYGRGVHEIELRPEFIRWRLDGDEWTYISIEDEDLSLYDAAIDGGVSPDIKEKKKFWLGGIEIFGHLSACDTNIYFLGATPVKKPEKPFWTDGIVCDYVRYADLNESEL